MGYNWGRERRRGSDRREPRHAPYTGPERRVGERRRPPREKIGIGVWALLAALLLGGLDTFAWHGFYTRGLIASVNADAAATREWSDNIWDLG